MKFKFGYVLIFSIFCLMALAALYFGPRILYKTFDLQYNGIITKGIVIGSVENDGPERDYHTGRYRTNDAFYPILEYSVNGKKHTSAGQSSINKLPIAIGDKIDVIYRSDEPGYVNIPAALKESFIAGSVCTGIGVIFTSVLGFFGYRVIKLKREEQNKIN